MTNRIEGYKIPRAIDDTGYGSQRDFQAALRESDSLEPLTESEQRWLQDVEAMYWRGVADGRKQPPVDDGGAMILMAIGIAFVALWGVVSIVNWLAGW